MKSPTYTKVTTFHGRANSDCECFCFNKRMVDDELLGVYLDDLLPPQHYPSPDEPSSEGRMGTWTITASFTPAEPTAAERTEKGESELATYQREAMRTWKSRDDGHVKMEIAILGLGLVGEAGEVAELIKKHIGHGHPLDPSKVREELGDVLWYIAAIAHNLGFSLVDVARANTEKLRKRYPDGFNAEASLARVDVGTQEGER